MGKAALLLVIVSLLSLTASNLVQRDRQVDAAGQQGDYGDKIVAREIAQSGFEVIERRVRRDFAGVRGTWSRIKQGEGTYSITAEGPPEGPVSITSTGTFGELEHTISGVLSRDNVAILDALTIDGPVGKFSTSKNILISGIDRNVDGTPGGNGNVHAVAATLASGLGPIAAKLNAQQAIGVKPAPDLVIAPARMNLVDLSEQIRNYAGDYLAAYHKNTSLSDVTLGSRTDPQIVVADANLTLKGSTKGYGILFAKGDLSFEQNASWEGLVFVARDKLKVTLKDNASIIGAMVIGAYAPDESLPSSGGDRGLPGGHFDVDVFQYGSGKEERYHEHQYDDDYDVTGVSLKAPTGCGKGGGLCWAETLGIYQGIMLDLSNATAGGGTYRITAGAGSGCSGSGGTTGTIQSGKTGKKETTTTTTSIPCASTVAIPSVNLSGTTPSTLEGVVMDARTVSEISFNFSALCALRNTTPGHAQSDDANRDGAFRVLIHSATQTGGHWTRGTLLYELVVYNHSTYGKNSGTVGGCAVDPPADEIRYGDPLDLTIQNNAVVQYSAQALRNLRTLYNEFDIQSSAVRRHSVRESLRAVSR